MSPLKQVDNYGFPIGVSFDFRRAMHRFERSLTSCPSSTLRLRRIHTLLIDHPEAALRELGSLSDLSSEELALMEIARHQVTSLTRPRIARERSDGKRANFVIPLPIEYGGMRVQLSIARTLAQSGFDVHIFQMRNAAGEGEQIDAELFAEVVEVKDQTQLRRELSTEHAALTFVGGWVDYLPAIEAESAPVIGYSGGEPTLNEDSQLDDRMLAFRAAAHKLPVHLMTCSRFIQQIYGTQFSRTSTYVPVTLDQRAFRPSIPPAGNRPFRVLLLAWDGLEDKGLGYAVPALQNLRRARSDIQVVWITPKPPAVFADLDCELYVNPPKDELYRVIGGCDVLVYPPIVDGLGLPPLEAMAAGVPVVVTGGTGPGEFSRDGVNALVVPPKSTAAIAAAVLRLLNNRSLRQALAERGRETASHYPLSATTAALLEAVGHVMQYAAIRRSAVPVIDRRPT